MQRKDAGHDSLITRKRRILHHNGDKSRPQNHHHAPGTILSIHRSLARLARLAACCFRTFVERRRAFCMAILTPMDFARYVPVFSPKDRRLQSIEAVATELCTSRAFVRLCLATGCPSDHGFLSAAGLLEWLFDNSHTVRLAAGLAPLAEIAGTESAAFQRLRMANALFTLFDFSESRASCPEEKRQLRELHRRLEFALERC